jgi:hypothetical protein
LYKIYCIQIITWIWTGFKNQNFFLSWLEDCVFKHLLITSLQLASSWVCLVKCWLFWCLHRIYSPESLTVLAATVRRWYLFPVFLLCTSEFVWNFPWLCTMKFIDISRCLSFQCRTSVPQFNTTLSISKQQASHSDIKVCWVKLSMWPMHVSNHIFSLILQYRIHSCGFQSPCMRQHLVLIYDFLYFHERYLSNQCHNFRRSLYMVCEIGVK